MPPQPGGCDARGGWNRGARKALTAHTTPTRDRRSVSAPIAKVRTFHNQRGRAMDMARSGARFDQGVCSRQRSTPARLRAELGRGVNSVNR